MTVCFYSCSLTVDSVRQTSGLTRNVAQPNVQLDRRPERAFSAASRRAVIATTFADSDAADAVAEADQPSGHGTMSAVLIVTIDRCGHPIESSMRMRCTPASEDVR